MNELPPCNQDIYKNGTQVFLTHTISSAHLEKWVQAIAKESNQPVDWHWAAGRAIILALGDLDKVKSAIKNNRDMHDKYYMEAVKQYRLSEVDSEFDQHYMDSIWHYNGF